MRNISVWVEAGHGKRNFCKQKISVKKFNAGRFGVGKFGAWTYAEGKSEICV